MRKLGNIEWLIDGQGQVALGTIGPIECAAVASDGDQCLAMLVRGPGDSLEALLQRLDSAIEAATERGEFIDEING